MEKINLKTSLEKQKKQFDETLILNPVENVPFDDILTPCSGFLHGLYNTDTLRNIEQKFNSKIQFSGRDNITSDIDYIYSSWAYLLKGKKISMRLLSGLHAHIILFMAITDIGNKVLLLPEKAGGHTSGKAILQRLGLNIAELPYDCSLHRIDIDAAKRLYNEFQPDILFVDRSEGLVYEDFTELCSFCHCYKIFDASQYLTNIICNDYKSPFDMGFDLLLSTMHKNLPGPQRALVCSKEDNATWKKLRTGISTFVSNMHVFSIYSAGLILDHLDELRILSKNMLNNAIRLDQELLRAEVPIISRITQNNELPTHHCWIKPPKQEKAFQLYLTLEKIGILVNYRLLPYDIGYGLRIGMSGAVMSGLKPMHIPELANLIKKAYFDGYSDSLKKQTLSLILKVKGENIC